MFKLKFVLPMLAFVLAIGMSFAFTSEAPGDLLIEIDGVQYESPINCSVGTQNCTTWISKDGNVLQVQVKREAPDGTYVDAKTVSQNQTVFQFDDLTPINP